jgi:hypothetical protein
MSNHIRWGRVRQQVRHESRWGRRVGTVQRRPRPVARSARAAGKALVHAAPLMRLIGISINVATGEVVSTWSRA